MFPWKVSNLEHQRRHFLGFQGEFEAKNDLLDPPQLMSIFFFGTGSNNNFTPCITKFPSAISEASSLVHSEHSS